MADGGGEVGTRFAQRLTVGGAFALEVLAGGGDGAAAHHGVADDERRTLLLVVGHSQSIGHSHRIGAVDIKHIPAPGAIFHSHILAVNGVDVGGELHLVAVVEHDQVGQAQIAGDAPCTLRDLLLHAAVGDEGIGLVGHHVAEAGLQEALGDGASYGHGMALTEGTRSILHTALHIELGVTGAHTAPLAQLLQLGDGIFPRQRQHAVEHRRHMSGVEEETVTGYPRGVVGVGDEKLRIKHVYEIGTAHGASGMARFGLLHH